MSLTYIGTSFDINEPYGPGEHAIIESVKTQIEQTFPNDQCLLINLTWFGPQFSESNSKWDDVMEAGEFDRVFLLATVDPPMIGDYEISEIRRVTNAIHVYLLGNFDSPHAFNFFAPVVADRFVKYNDDDLRLENIEKIFVSYNRKPKVHRVEFVQRLRDTKLDQYGTITLGIDETNIQNAGVAHDYISIGEQQEDYVSLGNHPAHWGFGIPLDNFSLHRMDIWKKTFLYVVGATEFQPHDNLFCQQDTFKAILGERPYIINGVQRTYRWLRYHGFRTFNHYWSHIDVENGPVHEGLVEVIRFLSKKSESELKEMYIDMLPNLTYNRQRFYEFAEEQRNRIANIFREP